MSRFNGPSYKGAVRDIRAEKRAEAEKRNEGKSWRHSCGHKHSFEQSARCAEAFFGCTCGFESWLMPGANDEAYEAFHRDNDDHSLMCGDQ